MLSYSVSIFKLNGNVWGWSPVAQTDGYWGDNPGVVLDWYLGGEELTEVSLEEGIVFYIDLPRTSKIDAFDDFQFFLNINVFEII